MFSPGTWNWLRGSELPRIFYDGQLLVVLIIQVQISPRWECNGECFLHEIVKVKGLFSLHLWWLRISSSVEQSELFIVITNNNKIDCYQRTMKSCRTFLGKVSIEFAFTFCIITQCSTNMKENSSLISCETWAPSLYSDGSHFPCIGPFTCRLQLSSSLLNKNQKSYTEQF